MSSRPEPVEIAVHTVRAALEREVSPADRGTGAPSTSLLGSLFHEVHAGLVGDAPGTSAATFLLGLERDRDAWRAQLVEHTYDTLLGPRLMSRRARLQGNAREVLRLWTATRALAEWIADLVWETVAASDGTPSEVRLQPEVELAATLDDPSWSAPVRLIGVADALISVRGTFCAVELKLGQTTPALDLGQAALYHLIVSHIATDVAGAGGAVALVTFEPERRERVFAGARIAEAQQKLLALIARITGVSSNISSSERPRRELPPLLRVRDGVPAQQSSRMTLLGLEPPTTAPSHSRSRARQSPAAAGPPPVRAIVEDSPPEPASEGPAREAIVPPPAIEIHDAHVELGEKMRAAFRTYGVAIEIDGAPRVGPRFLRFFVRLERGAREAALDRCRREVGYRLQVPEPIVSRADHRLAIDIARPDPVSVPFASIRAGLGPRAPKVGSSRMLAGVAIDGSLRLIDLSDPVNAHVLVAGSTGSGKTEWLRSALASLALTNTPDTLRFVLVDPKQTAFGDLERSPYLWTRKSFSTSSESAEVVDLLESLVNEMESRYTRMRAARCDDLAELQRSLEPGAPPVPRIVFVCDEYFALATQGSRKDRDELERVVGILGAKARASGIHLVIALQQASRAVLTGAIDGNIPVRVALRTAKDIDSRLVLQRAGAEALTGKGDLLFRDTGEIQRLQAPFIEAGDRKVIFAGGDPYP